MTAFTPAPATTTYPGPATIASEDLGWRTFIPASDTSYVYRLEGNDDNHELVSYDGVDITLRNTRTMQELTVDETFVYALRS